MDQANGKCFPRAMKKRCSPCGEHLCAVGAADACLGSYCAGAVAGVAAAAVAVLSVQPPPSALYSSIWLSSCARRTLTVDCSSARSEEHMSELQSQSNLVCRLLLEKKKHIPVRHPVTPA